MKDELAVSYLHFVESQNAELTEQKASQAEELRILKKALKVKHGIEDDMALDHLLDL